MNIKLAALPIPGRSLIFVLGLTLFISFSVGKSSFAIPFTFTLTGVTFDDGATASGFFVFNPTTGTYGAFNIITSDSALFTGSTYSPAVGTDATVPTPYSPPPDDFIFDNFSIDDHYLNLFSDPITGPGIFALHPGSAGPMDSFEWVNFSAGDYRLVTTGFLSVAPLSSVPDTSGTLSCLMIAIVALSWFRIVCRKQVEV